MAREYGAARNWRVRGVGRPWISRCPGDWITRESWATRKMRGRGRGGGQGEEALQKGRRRTPKGLGRDGVRWGSRACQDGGVEEMALPSPFLFVKLIP